MPQMPDWLGRLLVTLQEAADSDAGRTLRGDIEEILGRRFGPKLPNVARAQEISTSITAVLERVISICEEDQHRLGGLRGWPSRHNPMTVRLAIQRLHGVAEGVERVYTQFQPVVVSHSSLLSLPPGGADEEGNAPTPDTLTSGQNKADLLLAIYRDTIDGARQIREGISGANAANPLAVEGALAQLEAFARTLREATRELR